MENKQAAGQEQSAEFLVTKRWQDLERLESDNVGMVADLLRPLVFEAAKRPELRRLLPFISLNRLCFSRTTGYPYSYDCPSAYPVKGGGLFYVVGADQETVLGEGDAVRAADLLAANLPRNCGSAIYGTAEDLKRPSHA